MTQRGSQHLHALFLCGQFGSPPNICLISPPDPWRRTHPASIQRHSKFASCHHHAHERMHPQLVLHGDVDRADPPSVWSHHARRDHIFVGVGGEPGKTAPTHPPSAGVFWSCHGSGRFGDTMPWYTRDARGARGWDGSATPPRVVRRFWSDVDWCMLTFWRSCAKASHLRRFYCF